MKEHILIPHLLTDVIIYENGIGYFPSFPVPHGFSWRGWGNMAYKWEPDHSKANVKERIDRFLSELSMNDEESCLTLTGDSPTCVDINNDTIGQFRVDIEDGMLDADSVFTTLSGVPLLQRPADCTVSFLSGITRDGKRVIGLTHAGRDQIVKKRPQEHIRHLVEYYGCDVRSIQVSIPPSLMPERHTIRFADADRVLGELDRWGVFLQKNEEKEVYHIDDLGFLLEQYRVSGIPSENITAYMVDTYMSAKEKKGGFSHRYANVEKAPNGRFLVAIQL